MCFWVTIPSSLNGLNVQEGGGQFRGSPGRGRLSRSVFGKRAGRESGCGYIFRENT